MKTKQKHTAPALVNIFMPGLGQFIKDEQAKGICIFFAYIVSLFLIVVGIGLITTPIIWVGSIYDAYNN